MAGAGPVALNGVSVSTLSCADMALTPCQLSVPLHSSPPIPLQSGVTHQWSSPLPALPPPPLPSTLRCSLRPSPPVQLAAALLQNGTLIRLCRGDCRYLRCGADGVVDANGVNTADTYFRLVAGPGSHVRLQCMSNELSTRRWPSYFASPLAAVHATVNTRCLCIHKPSAADHRLPHTH